MCTNNSYPIGFYPAIELILVNPEIPQNTGNIARTCYATGSKLVIAGKPSFSLEDKYLKRAGMDYWDKIAFEHVDLDSLQERLSPADTFLLTKHGDKCYDTIMQSTIGKEVEATVNIDTIKLVFGNESSGLPADILELLPENRYRIPMVDDSRCINLAAAAAVVTYDIIRQMNFKGLT